MGAVEGIVSWLKESISKEELLGIAFGLSGVLLILPDKLKTFFGLQSYLENYRGWVGLSFLVSAVCLVVLYILKMNKEKQGRELRAKEIQSMFQGLTQKEKFCLAFCQEHKCRVMYFEVGARVAKALSDKGFWKAEPIEGYSKRCRLPHTLHMDIYEYLVNNRYCLFTREEFAAGFVNRYIEKLENDQGMPI